MTDEQKRKLREAMEDEQLECFAREKIREGMIREMELAASMEAYYKCLRKVGFDHMHAFSLVSQRQAIILDAAMRMGRPSP